MRLKVLCAALVLVTACSQAPKTPETPIPTETWTTTPTATPSAAPSPAAEQTTFLLVREGTDLVLQGKFKQALVPLEKAEKLTPDDPEIVQQLFLAHAGQDELPNKKSKAYAYAQRVVAELPGVRSARAQEYIDGADALPLQAPLPQDGKRPADVKGFDKVELGMTEEQVKARLGKRLKPFTGIYTQPNKYVPFFLPAYYFGKKPYAVLFPFDKDSGQLVGIYIRPQRYPSGTPNEFAEMESFVSKMYGPPDRDDDLDSDAVQRQRSVWDFPSSEVHVNLTGGRDFSITIAGKGQED